MYRYLATLGFVVFAAYLVGNHIGGAGAADSSTSSAPQLGFICDYDVDGTHQCWCEGGRGSEDCSRMIDSGLCKVNQDGQPYDFACSEATNSCTCWNTTNANQGPEEEEDDPISRSELPGLDDVAQPNADSAIAAPSGVVVSNRNSYMTLVVSWQDNSTSEDGFFVERLQSRSSGSWETVGTSRSRDDDIAGTGSRRRTLRNQGDDATLCYRIRAFAGDEVSAPSETVCSRSQ